MPTMTRHRAVGSAQTRTFMLTLASAPLSSAFLSLSTTGGLVSTGLRVFAQSPDFSSCRALTSSGRAG
jgi:hypothetical protein